MTKRGNNSQNNFCKLFASDERGLGGLNVHLNRVKPFKAGEVSKLPVVHLFTSKNCKSPAFDVLRVTQRREQCENKSV